MKITKSIKAAAAGFIALLVMSQSAYAISVYADFDGDTLHDATVDALPGSVLTASIYVSMTHTEISTNAGLNGFGVNLTTDGLLVMGNDINNIVINPQWNFATTKNIDDPAIASVSVVGNTTTPGGFEDTTVHLFDITLDVPGTLGETYLLSFSDVAGDTFVSNNFFVYDDFVVFADSHVNVNAIPIPSAAWLMLSGIVGLVGVSRQRSNNKLTAT